MKQVLIGIFAHPDDEAFGPSAYLYRQAHAGVDVHLILLTDGDAGVNEGYADLATQRLDEWHESGKRIGVASQTALHYPDGKLCNDIYLEVASKVQEQITTILRLYTEPIQLDMLTFEQRGISGHLDHIATSFITTFVYERLKQQTNDAITVNQLLYYCLPKTTIDTTNTNWVYMPAGYEEKEIDLKHNFEDIVEKKLHIMQAHTSQKKDMDSILARETVLEGEQLIANRTDHFILYR